MKKYEKPVILIIIIIALSAIGTSLYMLFKLDKSKDKELIIKNPEVSGFDKTQASGVIGNIK